MLRPAESVSVMAALLSNDMTHPQAAPRFEDAHGCAVLSSFSCCFALQPSQTSANLCFQLLSRRITTNFAPQRNAHTFCFIVRLSQAIMMTTSSKWVNCLFLRSCSLGSFGLVPGTSCIRHWCGRCSARFIRNGEIRCFPLLPHSLFVRRHTKCFIYYFLHHARRKRKQTNSSTHFRK